MTDNAQDRSQGPLPHDRTGPGRSAADFQSGGFWGLLGRPLPPVVCFLWTSGFTGLTSSGQRRRWLVKCPFCAHQDNKVIDSRLSKEGQVIRRRRECLSCARRFTTYERIEEIMPLVVKKDGRREAFDRQKIVTGVNLACQKRPVSSEQVDQLVETVERRLQELGEREVTSAQVGDIVMKLLQDLDAVAYVRFASVYRSFQDIGEFMTELKDLASERRGVRK